MFSVRLNIALDRGLVVLPEEGSIAVIGARASDDLSGLPEDRLCVVTRHYPDHAFWETAGIATSPVPEGPYAIAFVLLPRSREEARHMLALAMSSCTGPVVIDGQKTDGIDGALKELRTRTTVGEALSKAHGKLAVVNQADLSDWIAVAPDMIDGRFVTAPGVFSADGIDPGSALLSRVLPASLKGHVVDLGAGWGYLSDAVLARKGVTRIDLVEADHAAISAAQRNIKDPRARFHWSDALTFETDAPVDHVVSNPPFHTTRKPDVRLGQDFIRAAGRLLRPKGALWLVANRHLPYEAVLSDTFSEVRLLDETPSYKLFHAISPRRSRKG